MATKIKTQYTGGTIKEFIDVQWPVIQKARNEGATIQEIFDIMSEVPGMPVVEFSTFSTAYHTVAKDREPVVEVAPTSQIIAPEKV